MTRSEGKMVRTEGSGSLDEETHKTRGQGI